jgi:trans-aconitate methyltransferase
MVAVMDALLAEQIAYYRAVAPEMLELAARRAPEARFIEADPFSWEPDRRYDGVFFGGNGSVSSQETHRDEADTATR